MTPTDQQLDDLLDRLDAAARNSSSLGRGLNIWGVTSIRPVQREIVRQWVAGLQPEVQR